MKGKRTRVDRNKINVICITIIILFGVYLLLHNVLVPAYYSWAYVCSPQEIEGSGVVVSGYFNWSDYSITILEENGTIEYDRTLKHEIVHLNQAINNRLYDCNNTLGFYFNEVEASIGELLPDKIFQIIYKY